MQIINFLKNKYLEKKLNYKINFFIVGAAIGFISWGHSPILVSFSIILFFIYFQAKNRLEFFLAAMGYYLSVSRGLLFGTIAFYDDKILYGFGIWIGAATVISVTWVIFWSNSSKYKALFFLLSLNLIIVPPIGLIGWANPLLAAGLFFPGWGFYGIIALIGMILIIERFTQNKRLFFSTLAAFVVMILNHNFVPKNDKFITQVNSNFGTLYSEKKIDFIADYKRQNDYLKLAHDSKNEIVLLPENAVGKWTNLNMMAWDALEENKTVYAGATIQDQTYPELSDNVILKIKKSGYSIVYKQRVPVLISMWRPWNHTTGTNAYIFKENPVVKIDGVGKSGVLICYEQLLFYTIMDTMFYKPDELIAVSNLWWAQGTSIKKIEIASLELTSSLFNVPFALSINE